MKKVLILEDEENIRSFVVINLQRAGYAAIEAGADAVSLINTVQGMAVDWRRRRPVLGNGIGGRDISADGMSLADDAAQQVAVLAEIVG